MSMPAPVRAGDRFVIPDPLPSDSCDIEKPSYASYNVLSSGLNRLTSEAHVRFFDISRHIRTITGNRIEAMNVDAFDEVPKSTWFQSRNHRSRMTLEAIARGPDSGNGPDTSGVWKVTKAKVAGMAPGFFITDRHGDRYIIKFDVIGYPELSTSAEVVATKMFHAAGYNVPENHVAVFDPAKVIMGEEVKFTDDKGRSRNMTQDDLEAIFRMVDHRTDGKIRCHASKFVNGIPVGSFRFKGTRPDDPNDFIPHEHRRELRGLRVIASWIQHYDTNLGNTFDSYVTENDRSFIRHYLIDFGGTFGGSIYGPMPSSYCNINNVDLPRAIGQIFTLGLYVPRWDRYDTIPYPSVGTWESKTFRPNRYRFINPCEAFANMTDRDAFWGAKIVMSFTDEQVDALVHAGHYTNHAAEAYVARIMKERRDIIGKYYFNIICPVDNFQLEKNDDSYTLHFSDLRVTDRLMASDKVTCQYALSVEKGIREWKKVPSAKRYAVTITKKELDAAPGTFKEVRIKTGTVDRRSHKECCVYLSTPAENEGYQLMGIKR